MGFLPPNPRWREYPPSPPLASLYSDPAYGRDTLNKNAPHSEDIFTITEIMNIVPLHTCLSVILDIAS
jgi:hypothetical protein